jgi:hypothetical protein
VPDQFPVMRVGGEYFTMSLRMMKAVWCVLLAVCSCVWSQVPCCVFLCLECLEELSRVFRRSVRLRRGFVNLERAPFGGEKLRIPSLLFVEKMRTQSRFNVRVSIVLVTLVPQRETRADPFVFRCGLY